MKATRHLQDRVDSKDIGNFDAAAISRRRDEWALPMSERLARVHAISKQMSAIKGAARPR